MAANNGGNSERDLQDRLNALKRGSVTQDVAPKQDVLSDRLRALRNQSSSDGGSSSATLKTSGSTAGSQVGRQPSSSMPGPPLPLTSAPVAAGTEPGEDEDGDEDGFMSDLEDDGTLEEFLEDLELDLEEGNDEGSNQRPPSDPVDRGDDAEDDAKRIAAVLARIGKDGSALPPRRPSGHNVERRPGVEGVDAAGGSAGDDSEDDKKNELEAQNIVSQAFDEAKFDRENSKPLDESSEQMPLSSHGNLSTSHEQDARRPDDDQASPLDDAPTAARDCLSLPAVPDSLPGPAPTTTASITTATPETGDDFESDISRRLAALRGLDGSESGGGGGGLALPSAPSFQPAAKSNESKVKSTGAYTDEDQDGWCIVCLEDATSMCVGCDGDAYCEGCWRDMHLGPVAAFDGSHKRLAFVKERKKKRVLLAA
ncbi:hypothetical protein PpBr36_08402 [Pyricularia pennisetigena]|uniref:hypothetical protein n=1 Tax=Pyricularia pennisetigena TaxID=1578925 RepID=UPI0011510902|nr:hypothetical protein PpBr36_08402 [Pyricularia pennisetigena]TLS24286.1 hypothetical protein PpBr36_08402 [Pyricularia pennisetigena]